MESQIPSQGRIREESFAWVSQEAPIQKRAADLQLEPAISAQTKGKRVATDDDADLEISLYDHELHPEFNPALVLAKSVSFRW